MKGLYFEEPIASFFSFKQIRKLRADANTRYAESSGRAATSKQEGEKKAKRETAIITVIGHQRRSRYRGDNDDFIVRYTRARDDVLFRRARERKREKEPVRVIIENIKFLDERRLLRARSRDRAATTAQCRVR